MLNEITEGMPWLEYCDLGSDLSPEARPVNQSALKKIDVNPRAMLSYLQGSLRVDSPALQFGRDCHTALLEPDKFDRHYRVAGQCEATKKDGDQCSKTGRFHDGSRWLCGTHGDGYPEPENVMKHETYQQIQMIREKFEIHPAAHHLVGGKKEVVIQAEIRGVSCKGRIDMLSEDLTVITDLKTCGPLTTTADEMEKAVERYGYHQQLGFYQLLVEAVTGELPECRIVFVEKKTPYGINARRINSRLLAIGRADCVRWLQRFRKCRESGQWPDCYPESVDFDGGGLKSITGREWLHEAYSDSELEQVGWDGEDRPDMVVWNDMEENNEQ